MFTVQQKLTINYKNKQVTPFYFREKSCVLIIVIFLLTWTPVISRAKGTCSRVENKER